MLPAREWGCGGASLVVVALLLSCSVFVLVVGCFCFFFLVVGVVYLGAWSLDV